MLTFHRRRSGLRRDVMAAQMPASGLKQVGSMTVITNLSKCGLMTDSGLIFYIRFVLTFVTVWQDCRFFPEHL